MPEPNPQSPIPIPPPLTAAGQVIGTPQYMAPEQVEHPQQVDHRADIYSLGVVFYQMLTGELPVGRFAPPSKKVQIDVRLDEVVLRALEKEPDRRYQQASELKTRVETIVTTPVDVGCVKRTSPEKSASEPGRGAFHAPYEATESNPPAGASDTGGHAAGAPGTGRMPRQLSRESLLATTSWTSAVACAAVGPW